MVREAGDLWPVSSRRRRPLREGVIALALLSWAAFARAGEPARWEGLRSEDEAEVIRTLWAIAEAGREAASAEAEVAKLMEHSARGRRLSRWCYHVLTKMGGRSEKYLDRYMKAASWEPPPEHPGTLSFRYDPNAPEPPELPAELREASEEAWRTCFRSVITCKGDEDPRKRWREEKCLRSMASDAPREAYMPLALGILCDRGERVGARCLAAGLIKYHVSTEEEVAALLSGLRGEEDVLLRRAVADALRGHFFELPENRPGRPGRDLATPALLEALKDPDATVRSEAVGALAGAQYATEAYKAPLLEMLEKERDPEVVQSLMHSLSVNGATEVLPFVVRLLKEHRDPDMKRHAVYALAGLGNALRSQRDEQGLAAVAEEVVPLLIRVLKENPRRARSLASTAVYALHEYKEHAKEAVPELHRALKESKGDEFKKSVVNTLGCIGPASSEAVPDILAFVSPDDARRNHTISIALGRIGRGGEKVEEFLIRFIEAEPDWWNREFAVQALGAVAVESPAVIEVLEECLNDPHKGTVRAAEEAMRAVGARSRGVEPGEVGDTF